MRGRGRCSIFEALRRLGEALWRDAMHGAEGVDHVLAGIAVTERRRDQVEALLWHFGVLDVQGESLRHALSASAMGTLRRPIEMMRRGQGGARGSLEETKSSRRRGGM
jgi:hypothetical protein